MAIIEYHSADLQGTDGMHILTEIGGLADERKHLYFIASGVNPGKVYLGVADDIATPPRLDDLTALVRLSREDATALTKWLINSLL